jgi:hypothetical protein
LDVIQNQDKKWKFLLKKCLFLKPVRVFEVIVWAIIVMKKRRNPETGFYR